MTVRRPRGPQFLRKRSNRVVAWIVLIATMLGLNLWAVYRATEVRRAHVPYSPFFLHQVRTGNVVSIRSKGTAIYGDFRSATKPPGTSAASIHFATEIPAFADTMQLSRLLEAHGVVVNAQPLQTGVVWWKSLLFGFGPTLVFLLLLYWLLRRMNTSRMVGAFGRSRTAAATADSASSAQATTTSPSSLSALRSRSR